MNVSDSIRGELKRLGQHSSHYLGGLLGSMALGFVSFPIFTRAFSVADYGLITLVQKTYVLAIACSKLGLQNSVLRFYDGERYKTDHRAAQQYYSTMFFGSVASAAAVIALFVGGLRVAPGWLADPTLARLLAFGSILILLGTIQSTLWSFCRIEERTQLFNFAKVLIRGATIAAVCLLFSWTGRVARTYFVGSITVESVVTIAFTIWMFRRGLLSLSSLDWTVYRRALAFGLPLVAYELAGTVLDSGDRFLVRHYLGADALGFYSVSYGLSQYVNDLIIVPLNLALLPIYMRLWRSEGVEKTRQFLSLGLEIFFGAAVGIMALAIISARDAVLLLASPKYFGAERLIPLLVAGLLVYTMHVFLGAALIIHKDTRTMAKVLIVSAVFNMALNCIMLPRIGLVAAAIATLVSYALCVSLLGIYSFRFIPLRINLAALGRYLFAGAVTCGAVYGLNLGPRAVNLFGKAAIASILYVAILFLIDSRFRELCLAVMRVPTRQMEMAEVAVEPTTVGRE